MKQTGNYRLNLPEYEDPADIEDINSNFRTIDSELDDIKSNLPNIHKYGPDTSGDIVAHLTVGIRGSGKVGESSFVAGYGVASGDYSCAIGGAIVSAIFRPNTASGNCAAALGGYDNAATSFYAVVVGGSSNSATGQSAVALGGVGNNALDYQVKMGRYSKDGIPAIQGGATGDMLSIGNGSSTVARSNAFRVDYAGNVYGLSAFQTSGADVAEFYEWLDGNPDHEDRRGLFVTLDGVKIRLANPEDSYIKGVVSAMPAVVGDSQSEIWHGMYLRDVFGAYLKDEKGDFLLNPDYDPDREYVPREERPEFDCVSNWGKIVIVDDGTCEVNGYVKPGINGVGTKSEEQTIYRVMERKDDTHIYVSVG